MYTFMMFKRKDVGGNKVQDSFYFAIQNTYFHLLGQTNIFFLPYSNSGFPHITMYKVHFPNPELPAITMPKVHFPNPGFPLIIMYKLHFPNPGFPPITMYKVHFPNP